MTEDFYNEAEFEYLNLKSSDLSKKEFDGCIFKNCNFSDAHFTDSNSRTVNLLVSHLMIVIPSY